MEEILKIIPVNLDLKRVTAQASTIPPLVVGDNGNIFEITLTDGGEPVDLTGCKVFAVFSKSNGETAEQDTDGNGVTIGGTNHNVLTIDVRTGSYSDEQNNCELQIYSGTNYETLVTTAQFNFDGRRAIVNDETVMAEDKYPILVSLISQANEASQNADAAVGQVTSAATAAQQAAADAEQAVKDAQAAVEAAVAATVEVGTVTTGAPGTEASVTNSGTANAAVLDFTIPRGDPAGPHAAQHAAGGTDPITPAAIGAVPATEKGTASGVATLDANSKVAATQASSRIIDVSANITLAAQHAGCLICAIQSNNTITIPSDADNAIFSIGTEIEVLRYWSQTVTITAASDVYLYGGGSGSLGRSITIGNQHGMIALKKIRANEWLAVGDIG